MTRTVGAIAITLAVAGTTVTMARAGTPVAPASLGAAVADQAPDPKAVNSGKKLYVTYKCDKCHTIAGRGTKKVDGELDSVGATLTVADLKKWLTTPAEMEAKLKKPPKGTDSMANALKTKGIEPGEVDDLVAYLQTLNKK